MKTTTNYVAEDGRVFKTEEECKKYEKEINDTYQSWQDALKQRAAVGTKIQELKKEIEKYSNEYEMLSGITDKLYDEYCHKKKRNVGFVPDYLTWLFDLS